MSSRHLKYHYMYLTTHIMTGKIYIGIRSTNDLPEDDPYMGSGSAIRDIDPSLLRKTIITTFATRELAIMAEMLIVTEEFCLRDNTLNMRTGGEVGFLVDKSSFFQGIAKAKAAGKYKGRAVGIERQPVIELLSQGVSMRKTAKQLGIHLSTVQRIKRECGGHRNDE